MKTNQVVRIIIPIVLLLGTATAVFMAVLGSNQVNTSVDESEATNQEMLAFVAYLKIDGIDGEAIEANHLKWIDVLAFSHNIIISSSVSAVRTSGTPQLAPLRITKMVDKSSPYLYDRCSKGTVIPYVYLDCCKDFGGQLKVFYRIELTNAGIISVQDFGITAGDIPTETVSFSYDQIKLIYTEYDEQGSSKGNVETIISVETPEY
ncbi:MAG: Hcp family type VI secretion system effector [Promethearchaeota archaeon]